MNALLAEEARLVELMAQAETMTDLLQIEQRLTDVRYELEDITSQMRILENQVDYATIYLNIEEVRDFTQTVHALSVGIANYISKGSMPRTGWPTSDRYASSCSGSSWQMVSSATMSVKFSTPYISRMVASRRSRI